MKKSLLFLLFLAFSTLLTAQQTSRVEQLGDQKRRETYVNEFGYDSLKFTISGKNDTVFTETYRINGRIESKIWGKDSTYIFDGLGRLREIWYQPNETTHTPNVSYYSNGEIKERFQKTPMGTIIEEFKDNGDFIVRVVWQNISPTIKYCIRMDKYGKVLRSTKTDTLSIIKDTKTYLVYDTVFYSNGRIMSVDNDKRIEHIGRTDYEQLVKKDYTSDGTLQLDLLPDSLDLIPFKDNVDCYYGLKNKHGDTIYPARFDQINGFNGNFWLVYQGTEVVLMRRDGKILSHTPMNNLYLLNCPFNETQDLHSRMHNPYAPNHWVSLTKYPPYFTFKLGDKYGIMDRNGLVILPPQYPQFNAVDSSGSLFSIVVRDKHIKKILTQHIIDRKGNYIPNNIYPYVAFTNVPNFFAFSKTSPADTSHWQYEGLVNQSGEVLLEAIYTSVNNTKLAYDNKILWVQKGKESYNDDGERFFSNSIYGLYDPERRRWILPCVYENIGSNEWGELILMDTFTKKSGIVSRSGEILLPFVYDDIDRFGGANICAVSKNGQYQIYDVSRRRLGKDIYQNLVLSSMGTDYYGGFYDDYQRSCTPSTPLIVAQKHNKWGFVDLNGVVALPLKYDYVGRDRGMAFVKNNKVDVITGKFFPDPMPKKDINQGYYRELLTTYSLVGSKEAQTFVVDSLNNVLLPPQYKRIQNGGDWEILENKEAKRLILFKNVGKVEPFPYSKQVRWAASNVPMMTLEHEDNKGLEILNRQTGQVYQNFDGGAMAIVDYKTATYFVKTDTPVAALLEQGKLPYVCSDTFLIDDCNWRLYNALGQPLTPTVFRYPIDFRYGIGIGAVGDMYGVWRLDGSTLLPPQYQNLRFEMDDQRFVAYENRGLKTWLSLFDRKSKQLVKAGRYDGISEFYGKYALVSLGDKTGLIDSLGVEIIAPTSLDNDQFNLMDSLNVFNIQIIKARPKDRSPYWHDDYRLKALPIVTYTDKNAVLHPDSLAISNTLRNRLWQYLLQTQVERVIHKADFKQIKRADAYATYEVYNDNCYRYRATNTLRYVFVDSLHISFALLSDSAAKSNFTNYWKTKRGWERQELSNILILNQDNILKINALMTEKLRQLADKSIDCGESTSFIERTRNTFLTTPTGLNFYFTSNDKDPEAWNLTNYIPIHLSWAELKPFRTPQ